MCASMLVWEFRALSDSILYWAPESTYFEYLPVGCEFCLRVIPDEFIKHLAPILGTLSILLC